MMQTQKEYQTQQFYKYNTINKFQKQTFRDNKVNPDCEHVIRKGEPITLSPEQRQQFIQNICNIPNNPIGIGVFCGMTAYVCIAGMPVPFIFNIASALQQSNERIAYLFYIAGALLLLLVLAGFIGLCILITRKNRKRAEHFRTEAREKIRRGDYHSYAYRIEEIYRVQTYNEDMGGHIFFWYRVGDVLFELPNTTFAYHFGDNHEVVYQEPEKVALNEHNHPIGGYITGMLIQLDGQERFYGI
ncbi:MAG: hypothetical protein ACI4GW_05130 [Lachnospiraceae bacterium]